MQTDFRKRAFTPVVLPLTLVGAVLLVAWSLAQVLLVVPALAAAAIAMFLALYVLTVASLVASRRRISSRALSISLSLGLLALVTAGAVSAAVGPREIGHGEEAEGEAVAEGEGEGAAGGESEGSAEGGGEIPPDAQVFVAVDIAYEEAPATVPAGGTTFAIDNQGAVVHNVVVEETGDTLVVEAEGGQSDVGDISLEPGEYTYYCSVPGHRAAGMEGTLTAE